MLGARYETIAYDRRGAGGNVADHRYSLDREADDLTEFVAMVGDGAPVPVLAYSYGALISLHTVTTRPTAIGSLVAYEPPLGLPGMLPEYDDFVRLIDEGRDDDALRLFIGTTFRLSANAVDAMARYPSWQISLGQIAQLRRENDIVVTSRLNAPVAPVPPTRVLIAEAGGSPVFGEIAALVQTLLPGADVATVPGLPHFAIATEPAAFVRPALEHFDRH
jgi:pimeloyl-ACP methyl ester carboxylesterase